MIGFAFPTCPETQALCEAIVAEMQRLFGLSEAEAITRINRHWTTQDLSDPQDVVLHEDEEYWTKTIYYGKNSSWWLDESKAKPLPFP
jgi:hypothetical protein